MPIKTNPLFSSNQMRAFLQRQLKLRQLRLLVALDQHRQVSKVAKVLHLTQPAVSKALAELENGLGMCLFERTSKGLEPTAEGICLIRHAQAIAEDLDRAAQALESIGRPEVWRVTVGVMHSAAACVPAALRRLQLRGTYSESFELTVQEGPIDTLLGLLRVGKFDIVVGTAPEGGAGADLQITPLYIDPMVWIAACDHPLARKANVAPQDLADSIWVMAPRTTRLRSSIDASLRRLQFRASPRLVEALSFSTTLGLVCDHGAVALTSRRYARSVEAWGLVRILDIDMGSLVLPISAITLAEPEPRADVVEFTQCLFEAAAG